MNKFVCPYCYGVHNVIECGLKCSFNLPNMNVSCIGGVVKDNNGYIPQISKAKCIKCKEGGGKHYFCPVLKNANGDLVQEIPFEFITAGTSLPIALIGAKASGKSNYIAVLINEIRKKMIRSFDCSFPVGANESWRYYKDYYFRPLFEDGYVVQATDAGVIPPLIFSLNLKKNKVALTFYDTAGENLDSSDDMEIFNRYIPNSKGIILLLDPLQVPSIRKKLQGKMPLPEINTDVVEILSRVITNIRNSKNIKGVIPIPIALVFTKMDALEQFDIIPPDSCLREESEHLKRGAFVLSDFENTNLEMRAVLENWLDEEVIQLMKNFSKYSIFGLSALGAIPNGSKISSEEIKPKRVLDPWLWILAENKYIKTIKN